MLFPVNAHLSNCEILFIPMDTSLFTPPSAFGVPTLLKIVATNIDTYYLLRTTYFIERKREREIFAEREREIWTMVAMMVAQEM